MMKNIIKLFTVTLFVFLFIFNAEIVSASTQINGRFVITETYTNTLSIISPDGNRTVITNFPAGAFPVCVIIDKNGDFIVTERGTSEPGSHNLSKIKPDGTRTVIFNFPDGTYPHQAAIDSDGNFIITESMTDTLAKITPAGVRTEIFKFAQDACPIGLIIDKNGNYIVTEAGRRGILSAPCRLVKITNEGIRTVIYDFVPGTLPNGIAFDDNGNVIVAEAQANKLSRITMDGIRTVLSDFSDISPVIEFDEYSPTVEPAGPVLDNNGDILVSVPLADSLYRITPDGVRSEVYHSAMPAILCGFAVFPSNIVLAPVADKYSLWPPNNKMVPVTIWANVSSSAPVILTAQVSCNEPAKRGADWTVPVINQATGAISLSLRATRKGNGTGRVYSITITATDANGYSATETVDIVVPHDQGK